MRIADDKIWSDAGLWMAGLCQQLSTTRNNRVFAAIFSAAANFARKQPGWRSLGYVQIYNVFVYYLNYYHCYKIYSDIRPQPYLDYNELKDIQ